MSYDKALTVFSPDGNLFQVKYANEAVKRGKAIIALKGKDFCLMMADKQNFGSLMDASRASNKIYSVTETISVGYSGLNADARYLSGKLVWETAGWHFSHDMQPGAKDVAMILSQLKEKNTTKGGTRVFGVADLLVGFQFNSETNIWESKIFKSEPDGNSISLMAGAIGNNSDHIEDLLEKHYNYDTLNQKEGIILALKCLKDYVEDLKGMECVIVTINDGKISRNGIEQNELNKYIEMVNA
eukprot:Mrub_07646.p1 GENE.Mrub_07646~~Mrub_07646.p1  ORF type:complete len:242 (-),score=66.14 Mrub_07646:94-819(-)